MATPKEKYYEKRGQILVKNLQNRHFEAFYCATKEEALAKALELIPEGATIGWGGCMTAGQMGLMDALHQGNYKLLDRDQCQTMEEREALQRQAFSADFFLSGANGLSLDGQMVNIDGTGNRVAPVIYGPSNVLIVAGMNKVEDTLDMVVNAFHKQLDSMFAGEALDVNADIAVMENLMKTEGLTDDDISQIKLTLSQE